VTSIVILGPNLADQSKGSFHVHSAGCADIKRNRLYKSREFDSDKRNVQDFDSEKQVAEYVYADMLDENDMATLLSNIYFHACVSFPKKESAIMGKTWKITFELYNEELFFEMEIVTADDNLADTVAALEGIANVRNLNVSRNS